MSTPARLLALALTLSLLVGGPLRAADRPNVVVILADDQGWGDFSVNGNPNLRTPHVDSLAADGATFDRFYVCPVCSPTRAEFLTGRYHPRGGVSHTSRGGERLDLDESTIAESFRAAGYATACFGKWHNGAQHPYHPNSRGFDEFFGFLSGHLGDYFTPTLDHNGEPVACATYVSDAYTNKAMEFIEANRGRPFFAYLAFNSPHSPMQVPDRWWDAAKKREITQHGTQAQQEKIEHTRAALAMCENIDWNVGRVLEALAARRLDQNTIVVYFCDNGPNGHRWNGGMKGVKGTTDEGGVRSPLFIRWPAAIKSGTQVQEIAAAIDLFPTLADLAGVPVASNKKLDGASLKPLLIDAPAATGGSTSPAPLQNRVLFSHWNGQVSARFNAYRLDHRGNLYDVLRDPGQTRKLNRHRPNVRAKLQQAVDDWKRDVLAELLHDDRPHPVGHPTGKHTTLVAGDGEHTGNVRRSNQHANSSFFTGWSSPDDRITWNVEVIEAGDYDVELSYTCPAADIGSTIELSLNGSQVVGKIIEPHDPPLRGAEHDRWPRGESYVKDFRPLKLGQIHLKKGRGQLTLRALDVPASQVADVLQIRLSRAN